MAEESFGVHGDKEDAGDHDERTGPLDHGEGRVARGHAADAEDAHDDPDEERAPERVHAVARHAERGAAHRVPLVPEGVGGHREQPGDREDRQRRARDGGAEKPADPDRVAGQEHEGGEDDKQLEQPGRRLPYRDADPVLDEGGPEASNASFESPAKGGEERECAAHEDPRSHRGEARAPDEASGQEADDNAGDGVPVELLLEEDTT